MNVLALLDGYVASWTGLAMSDAYYAQELPKLTEARDQVATLMTLAKNACDVESIDALRKHVAAMEGEA